MAKQTLRRSHKSRGLQRKSRGLQRKSRRLQRKSRRLQRKSLGLHRKSRRLGHKRKSRIQRGGRILTRLELYTALMLELLDECYARYDLPDSQLIQYIKGFFGTPRNFIKYIKARMAQENRDEKSLGELITTTPPYNDSRFALSNFKSPEQQQKWIDFIKSLQETIDNMFSSNIDIASAVFGRYYELTNSKDIAYLRDYINRLKEGDGLGKNALHKALDRMIQWHNDQTTGKPTPSHLLKDIIAQVEHEYPTAAAEINKPKLTPINQDDKVKILPSFLSDSATLYVTFNGKTMIANSDVDGSAKDELGGLKQTHAHWFEYTPLANLPPGEYILVLKSEQYSSDPLIITVDATHKPVATIAAPARPAAGARPAAAAEAGSTTEAGAGAAEATARPAAEAATARPAAEAAEAGAGAAVEAGAGAAVEAGAATARPAVRPGSVQTFFNSFKNINTWRDKVNSKILLLTTKFKSLTPTLDSNNDQRIMLALKQQRTDDINDLVEINKKLNGLLAKYNLPRRI